MKTLRKWILIAGFLPVVSLHPIGLWADGEDDPPHGPGRPEVGGDVATLPSRGGQPGSEVRGGSLGMEMTQERAWDFSGGLWDEVSRLLTAGGVGF